MTIEVIGAGWGRTGTNSLKLALERLGYGTCHHMWEVARDPDRLVPLWTDALDGTPDWDAIFAGNRSAVDWPTAAFWNILAEVFPNAKVVLTTRAPEAWYASFAATIRQVLENPDGMPEHLRPGFRMARRSVQKSLGPDWSRETLVARFRAHEAEVRRTLPANRLLMFSPADGWEPLCAFLKRPVPEDPFPNSNHREEFFENVKSIV